MIGSRFALASIVNAVALAACSTGGSVAPRTAGIVSQSSLALTIIIPARQAASAARHAAYVSPSTQSLSVTVTQGSTTVLQQAVGLSVASNPANCTSSGGASTCTVVLGLAPGSYMGTFATYGGPVVSGAATGAVLSRGQSIPMVAAPGQANVIAVTLDGVPSSIVIAPASGSTITGTQAGGFTVPYTPQPLTVEALDAASNVILGVGAPAFTAAAAAGNFTVTQPQSGTPNRITLVATAAGSSTLTITAAAPDGGFSCSTSGVVCTATVAIAAMQPHQLFVAGFNGFAQYTSSDDVTWTLAASSTGTVKNPKGVVLAPNGNVLVMDAGAYMSVPPSIRIFAPPYSSAPVSNTNVGLPATPVMTASGTLVFQDSGNLKELGSHYTGTPTITASNVNPTGMVLDSFGNAMVSEGYPSTLTASYAQPAFATPTTLSTSVEGYLAVSSTGTIAVASLPQPYEMAVFPVPYGAPTLISTSGSQPDGGVTFDSNGNLWAQLNDGSLRKYTAPFSTNESPSVSASLGITANMISANASGDVFVLNGTSVKMYGPTGTLIGTLTPPGGAVAMQYVR